MYDALLRDLVDEARRQEDVVGVLLTGSLARGDALPGTDLDLRYILLDGQSRPFRSETRDGVLVEQAYSDAASEEAKIDALPMNVYAHLDGRILYDPRDVLSRLRRQAQKRFDDYQVPEQERATIAFLLKCAQDKIEVALDGGDLLKAAFVAGTTSWQLMEGLWAANNLPLPPNSSVRPHLKDLAGPADVEALYARLFLAETPERVQVSLDLIGWIRARLT